MNSDYEKRLAAELDRQLKDLPDWQAPATLIPRVAAALERRQHAWYRQPWQAWPMPARVVSLVLLVIFFGALCTGAWKLPQTAAFASLAREVSGWFAGVATLWNAGQALIATLAGVLKLLGNGVLLGCLAALALAWAMCLGVGTTCIRFALARR